MRIINMLRDEPVFGVANAGWQNVSTDWEYDLWGSHLVRSADAERRSVEERTNVSPDAPKFTTHLDREMAAYDSLPTKVARWLDQAPRKFSAVEIAGLLAQGWYFDETTQALQQRRFW